MNQDRYMEGSVSWQWVADSGQKGYDRREQGSRGAYPDILR